MSSQAISWVLWKSKSKGGARLVLLAIADDLVGKECAACPSIDRIATKANLSRRQVQYHIVNLVKIGELKRAYRNRGQPVGSNPRESRNCQTSSLFTFPKMTTEEPSKARTRHATKSPEEE